MVTLSRLPGISATVHAGGRALQEYDDVDESADSSLADISVIKYIEAIPDSIYSIKLEVTDNYQFDSPNISLRTLVDGHFVLEPVVSALEPIQGKSSFVIEGFESRSSLGVARLSKFRFTSVKTSKLLL